MVTTRHGEKTQFVARSVVKGYELGIECPKVIGGQIGPRQRVVLHTVKM